MNLHDNVIEIQWYRKNNESKYQKINGTNIDKV